jgi:hypothetical protein
MVVVLATAEAHTLYIRSQLSVHNVNQNGVLELINGTFWKNEASIDNRRISQISIIGPDDEEIEVNRGDVVDEGGVTRLEIGYPRPGTYVVGVSLKPRQIRVEASDFNDYLEYEGLLDDAEERSGLKEEGMAVAERYSKYAKSIVQVEKMTTNNFSRVLGHRVEIVPLAFRARILKDGRPLPGELVYANTERMSDTTENGIFKELVSTRSGSDGVIEFQITEQGAWYVRFIHLERLGDTEHWYSGLLAWLGLEEPAIPYESLWATLTFQIG